MALEFINYSWYNGKNNAIFCLVFENVARTPMDKYSLKEHLLELEVQKVTIKHI